MSEPQRQPLPKRPLISEPQAEFDIILSRMAPMGASPERVKEIQKEIESPDAKTRITYQLEIDPRTGAQKIIEKFWTDMSQCAICHNYVPDRKRCHICGNMVCGQCVTYGGSGWDDIRCRSCFESSEAIHRRYQH